MHSKKRLKKKKYALKTKKYVYVYLHMQNEITI